MERHRWTQERRRKQPSLYDEYMSEERQSQRTPPQSSQASIDSRHATIRSVSPDSGEDEASIAIPSRTTQNFERDFLGMASSPATSTRSSRKEQGSPKVSSRATMGRRESADNKRQGTPGSPSMSSRRRTMTFQGSTSDSRVPTAQSLGSTSRMGSAQYPESLHSGSADNKTGANGSNGLPTSVSQPAIGSSKRESQACFSESSNRIVSGSPLPTPNTRRILHLMKTLSGRMSGNVAIRRPANMTWVGVYCFIREAEGSLICEPEFGAGSHKTLIPDLRGCEVTCQSDEEDGVPYICVTVPRSSLEVHLRLSSQSDLDSWFAALLCWQPMQPKGMQNKMAKPQAAQLSAVSAQESRQNSQASVLKEAPVIKVGQMVYWDTDVTFGTPGSSKSGTRPSATRQTSYSGGRQYGVRWWRKVSGQLRENGELKFYTEAENQLLTILQLSQLSRSAIQRLDSSVLDHDHCIAIYPQYTTGGSPSGQTRPIFLSMETSVLFEVWFVLLRAFTIPQFYGPASAQTNDGNASDRQDTAESQANTSMFRMERGLSISIVEAKLQPPPEKVRPPPPPELSSYSSKHATSPKQVNQNGCYVEIHLDGETRGKTLVRNSNTNPFWSQEFEYVDLPAVLSSASVYVKQRSSDAGFGQKGNSDARFVHEAYGLVQDPSSGATSGYTGITQDMTLGKVEIILDELDTQKRSESWWPIVNSQDQEVGTLLIRARAEETVILMRQEYEPLHKILHTFDAGLTVQMFNSIPGELKRLSDSLVNIFQVSGRSTEWLMALVEDEIDGLGKETPLSKARYNTRLGVDADGVVQRQSDRELVVRDMNKNAALEANLLFRGNTLLTKALDTHMRRVGAEYLASALGPVIRSINDKDPDCEVDPNRVSSTHEMSRNWSRLMTTTGEVWNAIRTSAQKCPVDLRFIFRHIKACAEDRYGDFLRTVSFSSVSGFLFLRFFCPAVLSPKLFGLLKDDPKPRAKRTFVLVAKSLQTMANMVTFGSKEPWMEPMNSFLNSNRESFKRFIDDVCYVPHPPAALSEASPSYFTPNAIRQRLPPQNREGFPSLPYLLDEGREYANLVDMWLHASKQSSSFESESLADDSAIKRFHVICRDLQKRTYDCLARAERAERPSSGLSLRWEEIVDNLSSSGSDRAAAPPRLDTHGTHDQGNHHPNGDQAVSDLASSYDQASRNQAQRTSNPSSPISPNRRGQRDWSNTPNSDPASATISVLSQDRNPRSGFVIPSSSRSTTTVTTTTTTSTSTTHLPYRSSPSLSNPSTFPSSHLSNEDLHSVDHHSASTSHTPRPGSASTSGTPISFSATQQWGVPPPLPRPTFAGSGSEGPSRPASALSGRASLRSEGEETALPAVRDRERIRRERLRKNSPREEERKLRSRDGEGGLRDFFAGGARRREKERERR